MRRVVTGVAVAVLALGVSATATDAAARPKPHHKHAHKLAAKAATAGTFVPLVTPQRVLDTRNSAALPAGGGINPKVTGGPALPTGSVGSVVVTITAVSATATGGLVVFKSGTTRPATTTLRFAKGQRASTGSTVVPVSSAGKIGIHNSATSGRVHVVVDVTGYHRAGTPSASTPGVFHPVTPRRFADTRTGYGVRKGKVSAYKKLSVPFGKRGGVPAVPGAVAVTITAVSPTAAGIVTAGRTDDPAQGFGFANFAKGQTVSAFAPLRVADGVGYVGNGSAGSVDFVVDVVGYWTLGFAEAGDVFQTRVQTRAPTVSIPAGKTSTVALGGLGGVERNGVRAVAVTLHAVTPAASGGLRAWAGGAAPPDDTTVLQFDAGASVTNAVTLGSSDAGGLVVQNTSSKSLTLVVDINGYVPADASTPITGKATARYLSAFTGNIDSDAALMRKYGKADGAAGYAFVLVDVGAQSVSSPKLSKTNPGVSVALTKKRVAYTYSELVTLVGSYIDEFTKANASGVDAVIAVGTNNDGVWDPKKSDYYTPAGRGAAWANDVIAKLDGRTDVTVRGANDIEAGFASDQVQAKQWETAFLNATAKFATPDTPKLYFNGSADGCPTTWSSGNCAYDWTPEDYAELAGQSGVVAVPQIYVGSQATQWAELVKASGGSIKIVGILSESTLNPDFLTPKQAAAATTRGLASVADEPSLPGFVADFQKP